MGGLRIGIIGAGKMASHHYTAFKSCGAEIVAIVDTNKDAAESFAKSYNIPLAVTSMQEMLLKVGSLDAVSIAVPNFLHKPLAIEALSLGLNVYCEKPPALNVLEINEMTEMAEKKDKLLMFDFNNRARHESIMIKSYIEDGTVGRINAAQAVWVRRNGIPGFGAWFTNKKLAGGGAVIDLIHMIDLSLYFLGYPEPAYVLSSTFDDFVNDPLFKGPWQVGDNKVGTADVESACHAFVTFKSGQCLSIRNAWAEMNERERVSVTFQGTKAGGCMERVFEVDGLDETSKDQFTLYTVENGYQVNRNMIIPKDDTMGRIVCAQNFVKVQTEGAAPLSKPREAVQLMKIIDAIYESSRLGKPVKIS